MTTSHTIPFSAFFLEKARNGIHKGPDFMGSGAKFVRMGDLFSFDRVRSDWDGYQLVQLSGKELKRNGLLVDDLLFCRTSVAPDGVGKCSLVTEVSEDLVPASNLIRIRLDRERADPCYFYYYFTSELGHSRVLTKTRGAAVYTITGGDIGAVEVPDWPLPIQARVAQAMVRYDDLIENNTRRVQILEEMARAIYREWFVEFRYPGHKPALRESEVGSIPEGWEVLSLPEVAVVNYGKGLPRSEMDRDGPFPVYGAAKIIGQHSVSTVNERTLIMGCRGTCGDVTFTAPRAFVTNNSFTIETRPEDQFLLYFFLKERGVDEYITGSAQPQITLTNLRQLRLPVPGLAERRKFQTVAAQMMALAWNLADQNQTLRANRNLLLPRLLSGAVDVPDLDLEASGSVA